jgi:hypothetical protein
MAFGRWTPLAQPPSARVYSSSSSATAGDPRETDGTGKRLPSGCLIGGLPRASVSPVDRPEGAVGGAE